MPFNRICQVIVGDPKQNNLIFDQNFRITFNIDKNLLSTPKISKIEIYNLAQNSREQLKEILQKNSSKTSVKSLLNLYAGYEEGDGLELLYIGTIRHVYSRKEPPDVITTITCLEIVKEVYTSISYNGGIEKDQVWDDFAKSQGVQIHDASDRTPSVKFSNGYSHIGTVKDGMDNLAKVSNSTYTMEDNKIKIIPKGKHSKESIIDVNIKTGLIGSPEKIESLGTDADTHTIKDGWRIKMLLQPKIKIGGRINVESEVIKGVYIADSINHVGDTARGDWMTTVETKETQA